MVVAAVYDGDVHGEAGQAVGGVDAGKAAADDDYVIATGWLRKIAQGMHLTIKMQEADNRWQTGWV
jgi:hypothetical protein